jgi:sugar-specific transcriptional regulator TrmB
MQLEYTQELMKTGLSQEQSTVYEVLLRSGMLPASSVARQIPVESSLSRPLVYKILDELIEKDLVEKNDPSGGVATFAAKHPTTITKYFEKKKSDIIKAKGQFDTVLGELSSLYNLSSGKPGVQFYEGEDGIWEVLQDSLLATEEILTYADLEAIKKYIPELNAEYSALREDKHIKTRGLVVDSALARDFISSYDNATTTTKLIARGQDVAYFQTIMKIYDQKISYITLTDDYLVGVIITNQFIANTHKYLFESMWNSTKGEVV